jgi:hypothetical protein
MDGWLATVPSVEMESVVGLLAKVWEGAFAREKV